MTEHDEKWRCIACSIASAPESAPTHENAAEVKTRINSMELLQRNLTVSPLTRVTEPSTWRESESDMIHRIRRGLESVLDDQAHLSSLDPSNDHRIGLAGHSRQGSILMQKILGLYPGLSQAKSKLQHGETRKLLFKYRLQDGLTPLPSTWSKASQNGLQSKSTERAVLRTLDSNTLRDQ
ncbi:hypothetical protein BD324DRAFT_174000 [Kockovaella imperatae]|uniref:Uncharacterized protein n=1 Tax=Kockovaella imperatae TaxID=4999 RepID=A0A1Y1U877_9TREE|nr:hypothetical protein BD324DRAFT_174000 [Kockovaella imperatae]ORX34241.1 hypothetical protein BD324DRAFT_174000 [Kockovaella imperatae]